MGRIAARACPITSSSRTTTRAASGPETIRAEILAGWPGLRARIADRAEAIRGRARRLLGHGDLLLVAGQGPRDRTNRRLDGSAVLGSRGGARRPLAETPPQWLNPCGSGKTWSRRRKARPMACRRCASPAFPSITRSLEPGRRVRCPGRTRRDGHEFVPARLQGRRGRPPSSRAAMRAPARAARCCGSMTRCGRWEGIARAAPAPAANGAVSLRSRGSVGKDRHQGDAAPVAWGSRDRRTRPRSPITTIGGVPLTLARMPPELLVRRVSRSA